MVRLHWIAIVLLVGSTLCDAGKRSRKEIVLPAGFPEITAEQQKLTDVAFAKGAPAVVLLEAWQSDWEGLGLEYQRVHYFKRVKVLNAAGVQEHGDFAMQLLGDWRVQKVQARTVLPDGSVVDAGEHAYRERSKDLDYEALKIAFPRVEPGAILDVRIDMNNSALTLSPWIAQGELPVIESRFVMIPPRGMRFQPLAFPPEVARAEQFTYGNLRGHVWTFRDVPPLPDLAYLPPVEDIAQRLIVVLVAYESPSVYLGLATDWKEFSRSTNDFWKEWASENKQAAVALARRVVGETPTNLAKAERIRRAVRERVRNDYGWRYPMHDSPDKVLTQGHGTSADIAGLVVTMLRGVGVDAELAGIRRRSGGRIPIERPVPALLDELLVVVPTARGPVYFSPAAGLPVGKLPWDCSGVIAILLDGKAEKPVIIPDISADDNSIERTAQAELSPDGRLVGHSRHVYRGSAADRWRRRLVPLNEEDRRSYFGERLGEHLPGVRLTALTLEDSAESPGEFSVAATWEVDGYGVVAGSRMLVNPHLFDRFSAADWAPETRTLPIDLSMALDEQDSITIRFPEGIEELTPLPPSEVTAGPAGFFKASYEKEGNAIVVRRQFRLNQHHFPPQAYGGLRRWFTTMATSDDRVLAAKLPQ